jgi:hypothetical protein
MCCLRESSREIRVFVKGYVVSQHLMPIKPYETASMYPPVLKVRRHSDTPPAKLHISRRNGYLRRTHTGQRHCAIHSS